ncbi:serine/threonine protein phosphatase [Phormidesmis priestleyi ULC007]|uniref:Serine/threonine protein phosphatase n=1 Tax=Phormidesmis priestleyi ULC007 TaxID=1920490 RepID=A0A2T1DP10_9CYAN|nr:protein phosphatase 2C domain-containing protein [Phormidesmis priestleyi]PSB22238.1 serine/threonine protein phosphatase [Phormidesmis priestleyi ULC007]PZO52501.1 MAG: serine/threonine protein phosphatase [Phormidesmis priestleyi]
MLTTQCPTCDAAVLQDDQFCEECGTALRTIASGCEKCGASPDTIDAEGFCGQCGFRREAKEGDRVEVILNSCLAGVSDRGLRHHQNEDFLALQTIGNAEILIVCDGVSSSDHPELAAQTASESAGLTIASALQAKASPESAIRSAVETALLGVCRLSEGQSGTEPPSTTLVAAVVQNGIVTIGWLGDSRAYWISDSGSRQLTHDHSWVNDAIASGKMTAAEANHAPQAHAITRWLGADAKEDAAPEIVQFPLPGAGYLLLCSDGLWNYAPEVQQIQELVQKSLGMDAVTIARSLVEFARSRGGHDNITVALFIHHSLDSD